MKRDAQMSEAGALEQAKRAWATNYAGLSQDQIDRLVLGFSTLVRGIAQAGAVSPQEFASQRGIEPSRAVDLFAGFAAMGVQVDEQGNVVGAALTARQTPHRVQVGGRDLYAWCALDTLFIPGLLGERASVESKCPVSGETVRITVRPDGVEDFSPAQAVVTVVLPSVDPSPAQIGPASPT
jgi:alkylmercury lyase